MFKKGDRAVFQSNIDFSLSGTKIKAGDFCTIISIDERYNEDNLIVVKYQYDEEYKRDKSIGVLESSIRKLEIEEAANIDKEKYKHLINKNFHIGTKHRVGDHMDLEKGIKSGQIGEIIGIELSNNEMQDLLTLEFSDENLSKETLKLKRKFVEMYFYRHDEEVEEMIGEEIDLKESKKNYYIPGARMFRDEENALNLVVVKRDHGEEIEVEDKYHVVDIVPKKELIVIDDMEKVYEVFIPITDMVQDNFKVGNKFKANIKIDKHMFLKDDIQSGDIIYIKRIDSVKLNAFEDVFVVNRVNRLSKDIKLSYRDLALFFDHYVDKKEFDEAMNDFETEEPVKEEPVKEEPVKEEPVEEKKEVKDKIPVKIHELTIINYRYKLNNDRFTIDGNDQLYSYSEIDDIVKSLQILKKFLKND